MGADVGFVTARSELLAKYNAVQRNYRARTRPYKSTVAFQANVPASESFPTGGGGATMGHAVFKKMQQVEWFGYKIGDSIPWGPAQGDTRPALEDDTNLSTARHTNGNEDFVIEGISMTCRNLRGAYPEDTYTGTDPDVVNAYVGKAVMYDPAAIAFPPQLMSPFNLESTLWTAIAPLISIDFQWDRTDSIKIGTADEIPEGGAKSFLRAVGDPRNDNRYRVPEGYLWRKQGDPGAEFVVVGTLREACVLPVSFVGIMGSDTVETTLTDLFCDITARLHGLALSYPSGN